MNVGGVLATFATVAAFATISLVGCASAPPRPATASRDSAEVQRQLALAEEAERGRRHDVAREHYVKAIAAARDPASIAHAKREFAETLATWGEIVEAIAQLEGATAAKPDAAAWHDLGILRHHRGDTTGALAALEQARRLAPKDPRPRVALAALRWKLGDRAGATAEYRGLLELELPDKLRAKVEWALEQLAKPAAVRAGSSS